MPVRTQHQGVAFRTVSVQTWFSTDEIEARPGVQQVLPLSIQNLGDSTESYTIVPAGLSASWTTVQRGNITLFGGSQDVVDVRVTPPQLSTTSAGPNVIAVRVIPQGAPDDAVVAEMVLMVHPFDDRRIVTLQPIQRARHRANYEFMVENHGNGLASCRLRLIDPSNRIDGSFDPPAVGVAPGAANLVRLKARAQRGLFRRSTRTLEFEVEAEQQGHEPAIASLALVQPPTIPLAVLGRVAAVAALVGAAIAAWFGVVRPEIRDAADLRVDERIAELAPADPDQVPTTTIAEDVPVETTPIEEGEPTFYRLAVDAPLTQTADSTLSIPETDEFDLTDVRVENSLNDAGIGTLLVNGEPYFQWSLSNIRGQLFEPNITPIRLQPGDNVTFAVRCDAVGAESSKSTCTTAINIRGLTRPVAD